MCSKKSYKYKVLNGKAQGKKPTSKMSFQFVFILASLSQLHFSFVAGCGKRPPLSRVVNGVDAAPHSWPWQVSLRSGGRHICGGSLIRPNWIVTAAHCVYRYPYPRGYTVVVGAHKRKEVTPVQKEYRVNRLFKHDGFTMENLLHDVAVLELRGSVELSDKVGTVCLPSEDPAPGTQCYISGWGRLSGSGSVAQTLQQAKIPIVSHEDCKKKYSRYDASAHLCAGQGTVSGSGGCQGDSGGPLVCQEGDTWYLQGAVSFGKRGCPTTEYTVFARITSYLPWIMKRIEGGGGGGGGQHTPPPRPPSCNDKRPDCEEKKHFCFLTWFRDDCKRTCRKC